MEENDTDPWHFQVVETIFSFTPVLRGLYIIGRDAFTQAEWNRLETLCYAEINHIFRDCEWGRHNRATLRAIALLLFARLFPQNASAARCLKLADMLFEDSLGNWSIEDATSYLGLWVNSIAEYTQYRGVWNFRIEQILSYYCHYYTAMLLPSGGLPEFGDTRFDSGTSTCLSLGAMELMAKRHNDGVLKYAIERQFRNMVKNRTMDNGVQYERGMTNAFVWADDSIQPEEPGLLSCEVLDELVGMTDTSYISQLHTSWLLSEEKNIYGSDCGEDAIDLNRTLYEINRDIINRELVRMKGNQTAVAKKLGISRTTLWRYAKE